MTTNQKRSLDDMQLTGDSLSVPGKPKITASKRERNREKRQKKRQRLAKKHAGNSDNVEFADGTTQATFFFETYLKQRGVALDELTTIELTDKMVLPSYFASPKPREPKSTSTAAAATTTTAAAAAAAAATTTDAFMTSHELDQASEFLKHLNFQQWVPSLAKPRKNGTPRLLVVTSSAIRASNIFTALLPIREPAKGKKVPPVKVAKLFAKHMKVEEQQHFLRTTKCGLCVGTPNRLLRLCEDADTYKPMSNAERNKNKTNKKKSKRDDTEKKEVGQEDEGMRPSLVLDECAFLVFDVFRNPKGFTSFEVREVAKDLYDFYYRYCHERVVDGKMKVAFF
eukprot:TRINITY_DN854_c0_g2_i1.p1 TRINITY_DN854_c0_g2~~TRINITY_DN854_c0_g2_i1.p1  ORF type:complete len:340 (-),score=81.08 TRINITY_DN854_c0_g2_i1:136-1155(-)